MSDDGEALFHEPVLLDEVLELLQPQPSGVYLDATVGGGGHALAILRASAPSGKLYAVDRDPEALAESGRRLASHADRVHYFHLRFDHLRPIWKKRGCSPLDGILLDLGLSSHQLRPARGFSFLCTGPLDMRMSAGEGPTAADLLARIDQRELAELLRRAEVPQARGVARAICAAREELATTLDLARIVERCSSRAGRRRGRRGHHPATLVFQALRLEINQELEALRSFLEWLPEPLAPGGRIVVLSYHSLEDRLVKRSFRELSRTCTCPPHLPVCVCDGVAAGRLVTARPLRAQPREVAANPRSRSAVLRAWERSYDARA